MNLDTALLITNTSAQILVLSLLLYRRVWRNFPFFFAYNLSSLAAVPIGAWILNRYSTASRPYLSYYLISLLVDSVLMFSVLVELGWSVLKPLRESLPKRALIIIVLLILAVGAAIWPLASLPGATVARELGTIIRLKQTVATLAILAFFVLAAGSQFLSIGWRDRELQIATGLGLFSLVGIVVTVLHTYPSLRPQYNRLDEMLVAAYFCSLLYWTYSFAQKEQERRAMSPQAQNLLLAMAGTARTTRIALNNARSVSRDDENRK